MRLNSVILKRRLGSFRHPTQSSPARPCVASPKFRRQFDPRHRQDIHRRRRRHRSARSRRSDVGAGFSGPAAPRYSNGNWQTADDGPVRGFTRAAGLAPPLSRAARLLGPAHQRAKKMELSARGPAGQRVHGERAPVVGGTGIAATQAEITVAWLRARLLARGVAQRGSRGCGRAGPPRNY